MVLILLHSLIDGEHRFSSCEEMAEEEVVVVVMLLNGMMGVDE